MTNTLTRSWTCSLPILQVSCSRRITFAVIVLILFIVYEDVEPNAAERARELEQENSMLRNRIKVLERELNTRSPTKSGRSGENVLHDSVASLDCSNLGSGESDIENAVMKIGQLKLQADGFTSPTQPGSLGAKAAKRLPKRMTARQRDLGPETSV
jgi:hypothetical protein